jgi:hypothetical protein
MTGGLSPNPGDEINRFPFLLMQKKFGVICHSALLKTHFKQGYISFGNWPDICNYFRHDFLFIK